MDLDTKLDDISSRIVDGLVVSSFTTTGRIVAGVLLALFCLLVAYRYFVRKQHAGRLPPGPTGLPILGVVPWLGKHSQITFMKWCDKYKSDIISFYVGPQLCVVLNDYDTIKEAFIDGGDVFNSRPQNFIMSYITRGYHGITITEGTFWRDQRRFWLRSLHDLGVGRMGFEELCIEESRILAQCMVAHDENVGFNPRNEIDSSIANIICKLVFNKRFDRRDPILRTFLDNQHKFSRFAGMTNPVQVMPVLRHSPPYREDWKEFLSAMEQLRDFIGPEVQKIEDKYDPSQEPACVTEAYLHRRAKDYGIGPAGAAAAEADQLLNITNITINVQISFTASTETSVTTLTWAVLYFLLHPEMQKRCFDDIVEKVGLDRPVGWNDRTSLPYVEAFILEVWRRANLFPVGVVRRNAKDVYLKGYFIPKHTMICPNLWNVHLNEKYWEDPLKFEPKRHLDEKGNNIIRHVNHIPFSIGKRQCAGEGVARMELFLLLANLVQQIEFFRAPEDAAQNGKSLPTGNDIVSGFTVQPGRPFNCCVRLR